MGAKKLADADKAQAVMDLLQGNGTLAEICNRYGISPTYLYKLRDRALDAVKGAVSSGGKRDHTFRIFYGPTDDRLKEFSSLCTPKGGKCWRFPALPAPPNHFHPCSTPVFSQILSCLSPLFYSLSPLASSLSFIPHRL